MNLNEFLPIIINYFIFIILFFGVFFNKIEFHNYVNNLNLKIIRINKRTQKIKNIS